jgi:hypothetical protein
LVAERARRRDHWSRLYNGGNLRPMNAAELRKVRLWILFIIVGLFLSGVTAFPLQHEIERGARLLNIPDNASPDQFHGTQFWIATVRQGVQQTNAKYPFLAYGTDWLAFAHIILAILFIGPLRDPVKNIWVIEFGIIACLGVIPLALIAGQIRGIPIGWRLIDCSFGLIAIGPLWICRRAVRRVEVPGTDGF